MVWCTRYLRQHDKTKPPGRAGGLSHDTIKPMAQTPQLWHTMMPEEVMRKLHTSSEGISFGEVNKRLERYGLNAITERRHVPGFRVFLRQFRSPFVYLLLFAAGIAGVLGEMADTYIILGAVAITVGFGFFQETKAENTMEALAKLVHKRVRVRRGGKDTEIDSTFLVPGDIIFIGEGDKIAADARLIEAKELTMEEAALTGESAPVDKDVGSLDKGVQIAERTNMVFRGTVTARGRGIAVVVGTGEETELGKIAVTVRSLGEGQTPLQKKISIIARLVTIIVFAVLVVLVGVGIVRGLPIGELLTTAIAVAVAAIPESLVVAVTVILAIGMRRLLRSHALVRRLVSAETLGNTTVICVDKTGTLTEGNMRVTQVVTDKDDAKSREFALRIGMTTNEAYFDTTGDPDIAKAEIKGDPTERALLRAGIEIGLGEEYMKLEKRIVDEIPFESENQYMATLVEEKGDHNRLYIKGSPEKILSIAKLTSSQREKYKKQIDALSSKGLRLLAVAYRDVPDIVKIDGKKTKLELIAQLGAEPLKDSIWAGLLVLSDPLRPNTKETIEFSRKAGVRVVMITGDHKLTAKTIAEELGIPTKKENILEGKDLQKMSDDDLAKAAKHVYVYARITPHDKLRIVEALQAGGEVVSMTGDGVNDAPALKQADIGVAMGSGQDVAKEAADMVILDNNFQTIVRAIREGRVILDNIRKVTLYLLSDSFSEVVLIGTALLVGWPLPLLAGQILWVNIIEDALPAFALSYEPPERDIMQLKPEGRKMPLLNGEMKAIIFSAGITSALLLLGIFAWFFLNGYEMIYVRSVVFVGLAINSLFVIFSLRSLRRSIFKMNPLNNKYLVGSVLFGLFMLLVALYVPFFQNLLQLVELQPIHWVLMAGIGMSQILLVEIIKWFFNRKRGTV